MQNAVATKCGLPAARLAAIITAVLWLGAMATPALATSYIVTTTADSGIGSLRAAMVQADAAGGNNDISVPASLGTYALTSGALVTTNASNNLSINGIGGNAVVDAGSISGVFNFSGGTVTLNNMVVQHGSITPAAGSEGQCTGAGIFIAASTVGAVDASVVTNNTSNHGSGAGICVLGTLHLGYSTISNNTATNGGAGVRVFPGGSATVADSTFIGNQCDLLSGSGGGIISQGVLTVSNSTFSGNTCDDGSAIYAGDNAVVTITTTTIANNTSTDPNGQVAAYSPATFSLQSTIVSNAVTGVNCRTGTPGTISSNGHNLDSDNSCQLAGAGDLVQLDPLLGPLQNNGGITATLALLTGSPAIDHGSNPLALPTDQRGVGFGRVVGSAADIGAYEVQTAVVQSTPVPTPTLGRWALWLLALGLAASGVVAASRVRRL